MLYQNNIKWVKQQLKKYVIILMINQCKNSILKYVMIKYISKINQWEFQTL